MVGDQKVCFLISFRVSPPFPITKPGFSASMIALPNSGSKSISFRPASSGTSFLIISEAFSASIQIEGSGLRIILFFRLETRSFIVVAS